MNELFSFTTWVLGFEFGLGGKHLYLMSHLITETLELCVHMSPNPPGTNYVIRWARLFILCPLGRGEAGKESGLEDWGTGELAPTAGKYRDPSSDMHTCTFWKPGHGGMPRCREGEARMIPAAPCPASSGHTASSRSNERFYLKNKLKGS